MFETTSIFQTEKLPRAFGFCELESIITLILMFLKYLTHFVKLPASFVFLPLSLHLLSVFFQTLDSKHQAAQNKFKYTLKTLTLQ